MSLWNPFNRKDPKDLFLEFSPLQVDFLTVSWNFDLKDPSHRQWVIEVIKKDQKKGIEWKKADQEEIKFFENNRLLRKKRLARARQDYSALMNLALHSSLISGLEMHKEFMITPVSGATTQDIQNETRALQWIQASFTTLTQALKSLQQDSDLILTATFFSGKVPEADDVVVRLIVLSLDIVLYLRADQTLLVIVFNDKNLGHGGSKEPAFQQIIKVTKPQFYDEIVKLVNQVGLAGELK